MRIKKLFVLTTSLCLLLAAAAFGMGILKNPFTAGVIPVQAASPSHGEPEAQPPVDILTGPVTGTVIAIEFLPAAELPTRIPDAGGVFSEREGNTLTLQSNFAMAAGESGDVMFRTENIEGMLDEAPPAGLVIFSASVAAGADEIQGGPVLVETGSAPADVLQGMTGDPGELYVSSLDSAAAGGSSMDVGFGPGLPFETAPQKVTLTDTTRLYRDVTRMENLPEGGLTSIQQVLEAGSLDDLTADRTMMTVWGHMEGEQLIADVIVYQDPMFMK